MSDRNDNEPAVGKIVLAYIQLKAGKRESFSCFEDIVNICFKSNNLFLSKAFSHQRR